MELSLRPIALAMMVVTVYAFVSNLPLSAGSSSLPYQVSASLLRHLGGRA